MNSANNFIKQLRSIGKVNKLRLRTKNEFILNTELSKREGEHDKSRNLKSTIQKKISDFLMCEQALVALETSLLSDHSLGTSSSGKLSFIAPGT